jgi:hypothetical protein
MNRNKASLILMVCILMLLSACRFKPVSNNYDYDDLLNIGEQYESEFYYDSYRYAKNDDTRDMPTLTARSVAALKKAQLNGEPTFIAKIVVPFYESRSNQDPTREVRGVRRPNQMARNLNLTKQTLSPQFFDDLVTIDWNKLNAFPSDMLFVRGNSSSNKLMTTFFSSWTHVALIWNLETHEVFESMPDSINGVAVRNSDSSWKEIVSYGVKSVDPYKISHFNWISLDNKGNIVDYSGSKDHYDAMENAKRKYADDMQIPYWPEDVNKSNYSELEFFQKWSNKYDMDSMYCSKLVYWTFKDFNPDVDLDSNRTEVYVTGLHDYYANGGTMFSWTGVSPDDIWGSDDTTPYWELVGKENLFSDI